MAECPECARALEQLTELKAAARALPELAPAPETWDRIVARTRRPARRWLWPSLAAAAAVAGLATFASSKVIEAGRARAQAAQQARLETGIATTYDRYMDGVNAAIRECEAALEENPNHPRVRLAYLAARHDRLEAMDRLTSGGD